MVSMSDASAEIALVAGYVQVCETIDGGLHFLQPRVISGMKEMTTALGKVISLTWSRRSSIEVSRNDPVIVLDIFDFDELVGYINADQLVHDLFNIVLEPGIDLSLLLAILINVPKEFTDATNPAQAIQLEMLETPDAVLRKRSFLLDDSEDTEDSDDARDTEDSDKEDSELQGLRNLPSLRWLHRKLEAEQSPWRTRGLSDKLLVIKIRRRGQSWSIKPTKDVASVAEMEPEAGSNQLDPSTTNQPASPFQYQ